MKKINRKITAIAAAAATVLSMTAAMSFTATAEEKSSKYDELVENAKGFNIDSDTFENKYSTAKQLLNADNDKYDFIDDEKNKGLGFEDYYELRNGEYVKSDKNLRIKRILLSPLKLKKFRNSVFVRRRVLSMGNAICCPSVTYDMDDTPRPFFQNTFKSNGDWEAWERYSKMQGGFIYVNAPLMAHRIHNDSETSQILQDDGRSKEDFEMFKKFWPEWIARILVKTYKESEKSNEI